MAAKLIPSTAENACGIDYRLPSDISGHEQMKLLSNVKVCTVIFQILKCNIISIFILSWHSTLFC
jgi:hypothetical protein